jgi:hypothetical protein
VFCREAAGPDRVMQLDSGKVRAIALTTSHPDCPMFAWLDHLQADHSPLLFVSRSSTSRPTSCSRWVCPFDRPEAPIAATSRLTSLVQQGVLLLDDHLDRSLLLNISRELDRIRHGQRRVCRAGSR